MPRTHGDRNTTPRKENARTLLWSMSGTVQFVSQSLCDFPDRVPPLPLPFLANPAPDPPAPSVKGFRFAPVNATPRRP
jgi:hypothetical protein